MIKGKKIAIVTCCLDDWGGSEELWARSIPGLQDKGIAQITIFKNKINLAHPEYGKLKHKDIKFSELDPRLSLIEKVASRLTDPFYRLLDRANVVAYNWNKPVAKLYKALKAAPPDLVVISQGINFDGIAYAYQCFKLNIPYLIVSHKAVDFFWPQPNDRAYMKETLLNAKRCLFVSAHNQKLTEEQFGIRLQNSDIVINPVKAKVEPLPYPAVDKGYRLACVGRLFVIDKGQDMLLRILSQPKWRERNISVSFFGSGPDLDGLKEMAQLLKVENISFAGHTNDLKGIWTDHHALILASRSEGLPLTIIEAMSLGRPVIATNAGGNGEAIQDGVTGFVSEVSETDLDKTMENAWSRRGEWQNMGIKAAKYIDERIPKEPERLFVNLICNILNG